MIFEPVHWISNNVVCATSITSDQPAHTHSLTEPLLVTESSMIVKLLTEHHLEFLSLKGGCRGSSESTHVKMPHFWKSHATAHFSLTLSSLNSSADNLCKQFDSLMEFLKNFFRKS